MKITNIAACLFLALLPASSSLAGPVQSISISEQERVAVEAVSRFLAGGPSTLLDRFDATAPLRQLPRQEALDEIEARVGPRQGSQWTLLRLEGKDPDEVAFSVTFPSGLDDTVVFEMASANSTWRISGLRSLAEPGPRKGTAAAKKALIDPAIRRPLILFSVGVLIFVVMSLAFGGKRRRLLLDMMLLTVFCSGAIVFFMNRSQREAAFDRVLRALSSDAPKASVIEAREVAGSKFVPMRQLAAMRRALARGGIAIVPPACVEQCADIAATWQAQKALSANDPGAAAAALNRIPKEHDAMMPLLLNARILSAQGKGTEAKAAFREAISRGPVTDALLMEAWLSSIGVEGKDPDEYFDRCIRIGGSRDGSTSYLSSLRALMKGEGNAAVNAFRNGWNARPLTRDEFVREGLSAVFLDDPTTRMLVDLTATREPAVRPMDLSMNPIETVAGVKGRVLGSFLRLECGDALLDVPGGASIAPRDAEVMSAADWERLESESAVAGAAKLKGLNPATSPIVEQQMLAAAETLAKRGQWNELLALTEGVSDQVARTQPQLAIHRINALVNRNRADEARRLTVAAAGSRVIRSENDWRSLVELSDLMTRIGDFEQGLAALRTVTTFEKVPPVVGAKVQQLELRRDVARRSPVATTAHFEIRTTPDVPGAVALRIGDILEAEYQRLSSQIPVEGSRSVRVNVMNWRDFSENVTGSEDIVGIYDGEITLPFAEVARFKPEAIAIVTHELVHAMLASATNQAAPKWLHEGLATRHELLATKRNPFKDCPGDRLRPVSLLDAMLEGAIDPEEIRNAYDFSHAFVLFLEEKYGAEAIPNLIRALARGVTAEEALAESTKTSMAELEEAFRSWGLGRQTAFVDETPFPYSSLYSLDVAPEVRQGIRFSKSKGE